MLDNVTRTRRSEIMARVRSGDTGPELAVRSLVHSMGYRYRLHRKDLPGSPDLVFPRMQKVIFVHGCFWHQHRCKRGNRKPSSHMDYWLAKLQRNVARDRRVIRQLKRLGWGALVVWECQMTPKRMNALAARLDRFLSGHSCKGGADTFLGPI